MQAAVMYVSHSHVMSNEQSLFFNSSHPQPLLKCFIIRDTRPSKNKGTPHNITSNTAASHGFGYDESV